MTHSIAFHFTLVGVEVIPVGTIIKNVHNLVRIFLRLLEIKTFLFSQLVVTGWNVFDYLIIVWVLVESNDNILNATAKPTPSSFFENFEIKYGLGDFAIWNFKSQ